MIGVPSGYVVLADDAAFASPELRRMLRCAGTSGSTAAHGLSASEGNRPLTTCARCGGRWQMESGDSFRFG
jgi:PHP family Zn ribbon phosphoesterase